MEKEAMNPEKRVSAIRRSTELVHRTMISQATITSAMELPKVFPDLKKNLLRGHIVGKSALSAILLQINSQLLEDQTFSVMAQSLAEQATVNAETVISAAVIVLAHSTADDVFTGACGIAVDLAPDKWRSELNLEKKVSLAELQEKGVEGVFALELEHFKVRVGHKSLPSRAKLLFRHVPIKKHKDITQEEDAYYQGAKLVQADDLRKEIVHGSGLPTIAFAKSKAAADFLHEAALTALRSLAFEFALPLDSNYLQELFEKPHEKRR